jgi:4-amino-4-deoxy-L-arabinose transferase-like glycosyltransferase
MVPFTRARPGFTATAIHTLTRKNVLYPLAIVTLIGLTFFKLTSFPEPWFDEGSHLHVPKTLIMHGVYADYSSEGFRYFGPSIGIGPTVMLPLAVVFKVFGIGLLQARALMAIYLLCAIAAFFLFARRLGGERMAWFAAAILIGSQTIALFEVGRQVLGEAPTLAFLVTGWLVWSKAENKSGWRDLLLAGLLFGLAAITKSQTALILIPTLFVAWLLNLIYYRRLPQRHFLAPFSVTVGAYVLWQVVVLAFLGPGTFAENFAQLRTVSASAAFIFAPDLMKHSAQILLSPDTFLGWLIPILIYGAAIALRRTPDGQRWGNLMIFIGGGLTWYVFASISWPRYAFMPLALAALVAARLIDDLLQRFAVHPREWWRSLQNNELRAAIAPMLIIVFALMSLAPLALTARQIVGAETPAVEALVDYLNANVDRSALIETWEPELGFLTDHHYHFPPQSLLNIAVNHTWLDGPDASTAYDFREQPAGYVIVGKFSKYTDVYPGPFLQSDYTLVAAFGAYDVYTRNTVAK